MKYTHRFRICAPLASVAEFHRQPASLSAITLPPIAIQICRAPTYLAEGSEMDFILRLGPLPIHWQARIEGVSPTGFSDRQLAGPFAHWVHSHRFVPLTTSETEVVDEIDLALKRHPLWGPVGLLIALGLPLLFAYRGWKTRRLVNNSPFTAAGGPQTWHGELY